MAVVITSKFYQENEWKDISKVVFTSPNMVSPAIAGTRSHILPGEGDLGMWYEDTSYMYRIEPSQEETEEDFYGYNVTVREDTALSGTLEYIEVNNSNYAGIDTYIQESAGVEAIYYREITTSMIEASVRLEYTLIDEGLDLITDTLGREQETILDQSTRKCLVIVDKRIVSSSRF